MVRGSCTLGTLYCFGESWMQSRHIDTIWWKVTSVTEPCLTGRQLVCTDPWKRDSKSKHFLGGLLTVQQERPGSENRNFLAPGRLCSVRPPRSLSRVCVTRVSQEVTISVNSPVSHSSLTAACSSVNHVGYSEKSESCYSVSWTFPPSPF